MKRDMDLIRRIAMETEALGYRELLRGIDGVSPEEFVNHVKLMVEAGLLEAGVQEFKTASTPLAAVIRLTWTGHEFLDAARNNTLWARAKETVIQSGMSFTFDLLRDWLKAQASQSLPTLGG